MESICKVCIHSANCGGLAWGYDSHYTPTVGWTEEDYNLYHREYRAAEEGECFMFQQWVLLPALCGHCDANLGVNREFANEAGECPVCGGK